MIFEKVEFVSTQNFPSDQASRHAQFGKVSGSEYGYAVDEVDAFLARARESFSAPEGTAGILSTQDIRDITFLPAQGGYDATEVDEALERLEEAFAARDQRKTAGAAAAVSPVTEYDDAASVTQAVTEIPTDGDPVEFSAAVQGRLERAAGERFRAPSDDEANSYNVEDVDALCDRLLTEPGALTSRAIRAVTFRVTRGAEGYEEAQVDGFLERVAEELDAR